MADNGDVVRVPYAFRMLGRVGLFLAHFAVLAESLYGNVYLSLAFEEFKGAIRYLQ